MNDKPVDERRLVSEVEGLLTDLRTLFLSTVSRDGVPDASYAPYIRGDDHCFYVYVSQLARHTTNLDQSGLVSVLLMEDEVDTPQPFARRRLSLECHATLVPRDSEVWNGLMAAFADAFGEVIELIRPLRDFKLFRLQPKGGTYVRGFGQAYHFSGAVPANFEHITVRDRPDDG